jgi:putative tryptophan/tyrosine transport system substrate-binding protein
MRRRDFIGLIGGALTSPRPAIAQRVRYVGILGDTPGPQWDVFRKALEEFGYFEGRNVSFMSRYSQGNSARFNELAAELVNAGAEVIVVEGGVATRAAKEATRSIPIVMTIVGDPVGSGLVASLASPGGNITGSASLSFELTGKQLQLLHELIPTLIKVAFVWNPEESFHKRAVAQVEVASRALGVPLLMVEVRNLLELNAAFEKLKGNHRGAVLMLPTTSFDAQQSQIAELALNHQLPVLYNKSLFCRSGGLICFGARYFDFFTRAATFVDKILNGAKPESLPVEQAANFELMINLATAKALGITVPPTLLARADEVIE